MARIPYYPDDQNVKATVKVAGRRGNLIWRPWRGRVIVQTTPSKTAKRSLDNLRLWTEWLRVMNVIWHYTDPHVRLSMLYLEQLSGIPARDWFMSAAQGHLYSLVMETGEELFSVATRDKYSRSLDVFGQTLGAILYRDADAWATLEPSSDGDVLTLSGGKPVWVSPTSAVGGVWIGSESLRGYNAAQGYISGLSVPAIGLSQSGVTGGTAVILRERLLGDHNPTTARVLIHAPSNASGGVRIFIDVWGMPSSGELVQADRSGTTITLTSGDRKWMYVDLDWPYFSTPYVAYNVLVGRDANHEEDTCGVALNLLGVEIA